MLCCTFNQKGQTKKTVYKNRHGLIKLPILNEKYLVKLLILIWLASLLVKPKLPI